MRLWIRTCGTVLALGVAVGAGCGGKVLVDGGGSGGEGGAGGGQGGGPPPGVTTGPTTSSVTTGPTTSTVTSSVTTSVTSSSSTGPTLYCDDTGECGDGSFGCIGCSIDPNGGPCWAPYQECFEQSDECLEYANCLGMCDGDPACFEKCGEVYPAGFELYNKLLFCVFCEACYNDCDGAGAGCP